MIKMPVTFRNYNDKEVTEDWWFHLSVAEITEMELSAEGGSLQTYLRRIVASNDRKEIFVIFKAILEKAVGQRSEDGSRFRKSDDIRNDFFSSGAYDALFMKLITDAKLSSEFVTGVVPKELTNNPKFAETMADNVVELPQEKTWSDYTHAQLMEMDQEQFVNIMGTDIRKMTKQQMAIVMQRATRKEE